MRDDASRRRPLGSFLSGEPPAPDEPPAAAAPLSVDARAAQIRALLHQHGPQTYRALLDASGLGEYRFRAPFRQLQDAGDVVIVGQVTSPVAVGVGRRRTCLLYGLRSGGAS